jgi:hypothetical protein
MLGREEIYSLFLHLHNSDFLHNSPCVRNILIQPGPLTRPPNERSIVTPSFRIIDFGRTERYETYLASARGATKEDLERAAEHKFANGCMMENGRVKEALGMPL